MTIMKILKENNEANIFTYDKTVRKIVAECKGVLCGFPKEFQQSKFKIISKCLYTRYYDVYEESKREENVWNRYFFNIVDEVPIVEIDSDDLSEDIPQWVIQ